MTMRFKEERLEQGIQLMGYENNPCEIQRDWTSTVTMGIARSEDRGGQDFYEIFARKKKSQMGFDN